MIEKDRSWVKQGLVNQVNELEVITLRKQRYIEAQVAENRNLVQRIQKLEIEKQNISTQVTNLEKELSSQKSHLKKVKLGEVMNDTGYI